MAKEKLNLDEIMGEVHTVAELSLMLTGQEVLGLAKLVRYVAMATVKATAKTSRQTTMTFYPQQITFGEMRGSGVRNSPRVLPR